MRHTDKLERNYEKAQKRAEKKGRELPPRDQYYDHWGYSYYSKFHTSLIGYVVVLWMLTHPFSVRAVHSTYVLHSWYVLWMGSVYRA